MFISLVTIGVVGAPPINDRAPPYIAKKLTLSTFHCCRVAEFRRRPPSATTTATT
ncbi:hypothetical protein A2U01_0113882, partial [Trifolium medium]|nr:hypothetical protein [Trifolium medium]